MRGYIPYGYGSQTQVGDFEDSPIDPLTALNEAEKNGEISIYRETSDKYAAALDAKTAYRPTDAEVARAAASADTDFIGRNTESFCADVMAFFKFFFNFFTQLIGKLK